VGSERRSDNEGTVENVWAPRTAQWRHKGVGSQDGIVEA